MVSIYKSINDKFTELDLLEKDVWLNMVNPNKDEIEEVSSFFDIPTDFILSALDLEERSRLEIEDGNILILVDIPTIETSSESGVEQDFHTTIPFGIIVSENCIVTVCSTGSNPVVKDFIAGKVKSFYTNKKSRFILQILYKISTLYLSHLGVIDRRSTAVEVELHKSMKNKELIQLLNLEKSLVYFTTSLRSNEAVLEKLLRMDFIKRYPEDEDLLEDVIIENKQAIEMANIYSNILSGTMDAFASIISNNLNIVMKILTSITIIMTIPTMISSFYGMNVALPFSDRPYAFLLIIGISVVSATLLTLLMIRKKLF